MRKAIRVGRLFGVEIRIDPSWIFIFGLLVWSLTSVFSGWHPSWTTGSVLASAIVTALAFFASVLVHELAHALCAKAYKLPVRDITLHLFGGVSNIEREPPTPGAELLIAAVGPLTSVVLGVGMLAIAAVATGTGATLTASADADATAAMSRLSPPITLLMWLGPVNIALGAFNLIPGFPMDGGRILRAIIWKVTGNIATATRWSTASGQAIGVAFMVAGASMALGLHLPFFGAGLTSGLWLVFIGMFLRGAAKQHQAGADTALALDGVTVSALMRPSHDGVQGNTSVRALVDGWFVRRDEGVAPVFFGERFVGVVALVDVAKIPRGDWADLTAREIMRSPASLPPIASTDAMIDALRKVSAAGLTALPVIDDGELVGMLFERDVARWLTLRAPRTTALGQRAPA